MIFRKFVIKSLVEGLPKEKIRTGKQYDIVNIFISKFRNSCITRSSWIIERHEVHLTVRWTLH